MNGVHTLVVVQSSRAASRGERTTLLIIAQVSSSFQKIAYAQVLQIQVLSFLKEGFSVHIQSEGFFNSHYIPGNHAPDEACLGRNCGHAV